MVQILIMYYVFSKDWGWTRTRMNCVNEIVYELEPV